MTEVTEKDKQFVRELYWDEAAEQVAAYRERCVAGERAERERMAVAMQEAIDRELAAREKAEARLRAVIEAADVALAFHENYPKCKCPLCSHYRRVRDAQASPEPEASKPVGHEFNSTARPWVKFADEQDTCRICGLPSSKHGGRDVE